jgi:hypothetical protein
MTFNSEPIILVAHLEYEHLITGIRVHDTINKREQVSFFQSLMEISHVTEMLPTLYPQTLLFQL